MVVVVVLVPAGAGVDPESGGTVQRLLSQQRSLIQPGLSFINSSSLGGVTRTSLGDIRNLTQSAATVSATINIVNWSRWLLGYPVYYFKYGHFKHGEQKNRIVGSTQHLNIIRMIYESVHQRFLPPKTKIIFDIYIFF